MVNAVKQHRHDSRLIFGAVAIRSFAFGFLATMFGVYLAHLGLSSTAIGVMFAVALAGGAVSTLLLGAHSGSLGRRRVLRGCAALMIAAATILLLTTNVAVMAVALAVGSMSPAGKDSGPFLAIEQAVLPDLHPTGRRTHVFALYNLTGALASAFGALFAAAPVLLGASDAATYRILLWTYLGMAVALLSVYLRLSAGVEVTSEHAPALNVDRHRATGIIAKLALLFALDSFAGGLVVQAIIAYWFSARYGFSLATLGPLLFGANLCAAGSFLAAAPLAKRIGLLNTMVFTHLPSNVLLMLVPLVPGAPFAVALFLIRQTLSQLDVPTRQSYTMAIVAPSERAAVASITAVARTSASAIAPALSGVTLAVPAVGIPFLLAGGLKIVYDLALLFTFRHVRPPEEQILPQPRSKDAT